MSRLSPLGVSICIDMGTTNTRVWLVEEGRIIERSTEQIGLRNGARAGSETVVKDTLARMIACMIDRASAGKPVSRILAAGMLTSPLGLKEIKHIPAPAAEKELSVAAQRLSIPEVSNLPLYLVPGVRTGPVEPRIEELASIDLIRGEETVIVGLIQAGSLGPHGTLLNLGSHWKAISLDHQGRIIASHTTLSGELIQALQEGTVLASALPLGKITDLDSEWLQRGRDFEFCSGVGRSLFAVRLLEQVFKIGSEKAGSFLLGALIQSDLTGMQAAGHLAGDIVISGMGAAAQAWQQCLQSVGQSAVLCPPEAIEQAFVTGLHRILSLRAEISSV
jgi:2-dehydro-3-deoxygalactonokinase